ncbi:MAG TPA: HEAT repeat domain-containing protein [Acidimicrobiia bacterium]|nr:HEAT repeat domain-containing protein [Acidimicrobiia bacterium]
MNGTQIAFLAVGIVFVVDAVLLLGLITLKTVHRQRMERHDRRRSAYLGVLSRRMAYPLHTDYIGPKVARDSAFLDAVIDLRNTMAGPEIDTLAGIIDRYGLVKHQTAHLRSRFPLGRRLRAAVSLAEMGDESSAPVLIEFLNDREPEIRIQCARGLGRMHHTPAIDAIIDRFGEESPWVRSRFADTLVGFGVGAAWSLLAYIRVNHDHGDNAGVIEAIRVLGTIGERDVGPGLSELLGRFKDPELVIAAIDALGYIGGPLAVTPLVAFLHADDWRLRAKAAHSLGEIGDPLANPALRSGLEDDDWWVRRNSAAALADMSGGLEILHKTLHSDDVFARDAAAEALADCGELGHARERRERGEATHADLELLSFMIEDALVP